MAAKHDILQLKTEAELRFFVDNPSYYQPELVAAARRELRLRGLSPVPLAAQPAAPLADFEPATTHAEQGNGSNTQAQSPPAHRSWLLLGSVAAVFFLAGLGFWFKSPAPQATAPVAAKHAAPADSSTTAASLKLEEAPASPIPTFDTEKYVDKALARVPASEKQNELITSQYRTISRLFWAAQNPSTYLIQQAQAGKPNPVFGAQLGLGLELWRNFDRTQVYSYSFGPVMADHLSRMKTIAQYQREALKELTYDVEAQRRPYLDDNQTLAHQEAIPHLLTALERKTGPTPVHL
jgi:hypothetical protein